MIFTLGNIGSRMISFFLIPLYTNVLTTSQYGTVDLITTISTVAGPMLTLNIAESVMRFGLDKDADKEKNTQCGSIVLLIAMIIGLVLIPICRCITEVSDYAMYVYFMSFLYLLVSCFYAIYAERNCYLSIHLEISFRH